MASRALDDDQIALLNLQARANLLPVIGSTTQLQGNTSFCPVFLAYGKMANGRFCGFWAVIGQGQWKQAGQEMEFSGGDTEDMVIVALIKHAESWLGEMSRRHMLDKGFWSHNRGH